MHNALGVKNKPESIPVQFINNAAIDGKARKLIRSHAAKGKNVGKRRPFKQQQGVKTPAPIYSNSLRAMENELISESRRDQVAEIERPLGDGLSVLFLPAELNAKSKGLFTRAFSFLTGPFCISELSNVINFQLVESKRIWIQSIFLDEAYFHCMIAMFVAVVRPALLMQSDSITAMYHLSQTLRLANEKLSGRKALSDTTMVVVIAMTQYERSQARYDQGLIHFKGLQRMIELRGGILPLIKFKPGIAQKVFRADLDFALHLGLPTHFTIEDLSGYASIIWFRNKFEQAQEQHIVNSMLFRGLKFDLRDVLKDVSSLAWLLNGSIGQGIQLDSGTFHEILIWIGYRLIRISPLAKQQPMSYRENMSHLGLIAFLTTFLHGFSCTRPEYALLSQLTRSALQGHVEKDEESRELFLWTLFIGGVTIFGTVDDMWLIPKITETASLLELCSWESICGVLSKFPWVNAVYDKPSQELWRRSKLRCETATGLRNDIPN